MHGKLNDGLFSFLIQTNFSESFPLLDAWAGYHPSETISLFFGQKLSPLNNLSMQIMEYDLQFASRNYLSQNFLSIFILNQGSVELSLSFCNFKLFSGLKFTKRSKDI